MHIRLTHTILAVNIHVETHAPRDEGRSGLPLASLTPLGETNVRVRNNPRAGKEILGLLETQNRNHLPSPRQARKEPPRNKPNRVQGRSLRPQTLRPHRGRPLRAYEHHGVLDEDDGNTKKLPGNQPIDLPAQSPSSKRRAFKNLHKARRIDEGLLSRSEEPLSQL